MKKVTIILVLFMLAAFKAEAGFSGVPETTMFGARFGYLVQDKDGTCFIQLWDSASKSRVIMFDAMTPIGINFMSILQLAYSKGVNTITVTYDKADITKTVPYTNEVVYLKLTSVRI